MPAGSFLCVVTEAGGWEKRGDTVHGWVVLLKSVGVPRTCRSFLPSSLPCQQPRLTEGLGGPGVCNKSYGPSWNIRWKRGFESYLNDLPAKTWVHLIVCSQVLCLVPFCPVASDEIFRTSFGSLSLPHSRINSPQCIFKLRFCLCFPQVITHDGISVYLKKSYSILNLYKLAGMWLSVCCESTRCQSISLLLEGLHDSRKWLIFKADAAFNLQKRQQTFHLSFADWIWKWMNDTWLKCVSKLVFIKYNRSMLIIRSVLKIGLRMYMVLKSEWA